MSPVRRALPLVIAASLAAGSATASELRFTQRPVPGQYIVVLKDEAAALNTEASALSRLPSVASVAAQLASRHGARMQRSFSHTLRGFVVQADDRALEKLVLDPAVAYVEEDGIEVAWLYRPTLMSKSELENLDRLYQSFLASACRSPEVRIGSLGV